MDVLIAYIQFKMANINDGYGLSEKEIVDVLVNVYKDSNTIEVEGKKPIYNFDPYESWEKWCVIASAVETIEAFEVEGLNNKLQEFNLKAISLMQKEG